jgi:hypothetical protein
MLRRRWESKEAMWRGTLTQKMTRSPHTKRSTYGSGAVQRVTQIAKSKTWYQLCHLWPLLTGPHVRLVLNIIALCHLSFAQYQSTSQKTSLKFSELGRNTLLNVCKRASAWQWLEPAQN